MNKTTCKAYIRVGILSVLIGIGTYMLAKTTPSESISAHQYPIANPQVRVYSNSGRPPAYIDEKPFGSLDKVIDYQNGKRVERTATEKDNKEFEKYAEKAMQQRIF